MKNLNAIKKLFSLTVLCTVISGCTIEPVQFERDLGIKGAPDWVNKGSKLANTNGRVFIGVSSSTPQGDMALQKSIADDRSKAEIGVVLGNYLDVVANDYMLADRSGDSAVNGEPLSRQARENATRQVEEAASRHVNEVVSKQIDDAVLYHFKEEVSRQLKDDISRQVKKDALRYINDAISYQSEFTLHLDKIIAQQVKEAVSRQIKGIVKASMTGTRIVGSWRDPQTNTIWSISELDIKHVKSAMDGVSDLNVSMKRFFDTNADNIFDRVIIERSDTNSFVFR